MTKGLDALKVSLTKNGYLKVAEVIKQHPRTEILANINGVYPGINLNDGQIKGMLSFDSETGEFPEVWDEVKAYGADAIDALVLISVIYSHNKLIEVFSNSILSEMRGYLRREALGDKEYTNLVHSMNKLGMCPLNQGADETAFDVTPLFNLEIGGLVKKIITLKLIKTGWKEPAADDYFSRDFYEQCEFYNFNGVLGLSIEQFQQWLEGEDVQREEPPIVEIPVQDLSTSAALISALVSKPFVILAGSTGTGKTKTIRELAHQLNPLDAEPDFNHAFIPVEAGWTDSRHLLGYKSPFGKSGEHYVSTKLINLLLKANYPDYANVPFFVILDEMNLSHTEMYFSKFLSVMETVSDAQPEALLGIDELKLLYKSELTDPIQATYLKSAIDNKGLYITNNVFFVGTVNMDETTYMFSPKVLDRSFVLQYLPPKPSQVQAGFTISPHDELKADSKKLSEFLTASVDGFDNSADQFLDELYDTLGKFKFGPRTTNEIRRYLSVCEKVCADFTIHDQFKGRSAVFDRLIAQKILPKIHGNRDTLQPLFKSLKVLFDREQLIDSNDKLEQMKKTVMATGFTNYFSAI